MRPSMEGGLRYDDPRLGLQLAAAGGGDLAEGRGVASLDEMEAESRRSDRAVERCVDRTEEAAHDHRRQGAEGARSARASPSGSGMVGAGFMGQGLTNQIVNSVPGMRMVGDLQPRARAGGATSTATPAASVVAADDPERRSTTAVGQGIPVVAEDPFPICRSPRDRRHRRRHRLGRVRRAGHPRGVRARQAGRADERRGRRHHRPDPPGLRPQHGRDPVRAATATSPACR